MQVERHPGPLPYGVGCKDVIEVSMSRHHSDQTQAVALDGRHDVVGLVPGIDHHGLIGFGVADQVAVALELPNDQMLVDVDYHSYSVPSKDVGSGAAGAMEYVGRHVGILMCGRPRGSPTM